MGRERPALFYYVFDLLRLNGKDLQRRPLTDRKARLEELLRHPRSPFVAELVGVPFEALALGVGQPLIKPRSIDDVPVLALTLSGPGLDGYALRQAAAAAVEREQWVGVDAQVGGCHRIGHPARGGELDPVLIIPGVEGMGLNPGVGSRVSKAVIYFKAVGIHIWRIDAGVYQVFLDRVIVVNLGAGTGAAGYYRIAVVGCQASG